MDELVKRKGDGGLTLLLIFKTLKNSVLEQLEDENPEIDWIDFEDDINRECITIAKEILNKSKNPNEEDIKRIIESIKENRINKQP